MLRPECDVKTARVWVPALNAAVNDFAVTFSAGTAVPSTNGIMWSAAFPKKIELVPELEMLTVVRYQA